MRTISAVVDIAAAPQQVWTVLADLDAYQGEEAVWSPRDGYGELVSGASSSWRSISASCAVRAPAVPPSGSVSRCLSSDTTLTASWSAAAPCSVSDSSTARGSAAFVERVTKP